MEQSSQIQIESLIKTITKDFEQQFSLMIKDIRVVLNFENPNFEIPPQILIIFQHQFKKISDSLKILLINQQISTVTQKSQFQNEEKFDEILDIIRKQKEDLSYFFQSNSEEPELDLMKFMNRIKKDLATIKLQVQKYQDTSCFEYFSHQINYLLISMQIETDNKEELKKKIQVEYNEFESKIQKSVQTNSQSQIQYQSSQQLILLQDSISKSTIQSFNVAEQFGIKIKNTNFIKIIESPLNDLIKFVRTQAAISLQNQSQKQFNENFIKLQKNLLQKLDEKYRDFKNKLSSLEQTCLLDYDEKMNPLKGNLLLWHIKQCFDILNSYNCEEIVNIKDQEQENILKHLQNKLDINLEKQIENYDSHDNDHKVKECLVFHLLKMQSVVPEQSITNFCQNSIQQIWGMENDGRILKLLKNKEMIDLQKKMFSQDLQQYSDRLKSDINQRLEQLNQLEYQIVQEGIQQKRQQLQEQLEQQYKEFDIYLEGISDMASKLDLGLFFLMDIRKQLSQIKTKIDLIQNSIIEIGKDLRKLKGKDFEELLMMRRETVLEQKQQFDMRSVYIPLKVQEWDPKTGFIIPGFLTKETILLSEDPSQIDGEVNEFLYDDKDKNKDVMLIRGFAGSGKSRAAKKIEEFLWDQYDKDEKNQRKKWTPIFVSLPTIREPRFNLIDQSLESDFYKFDSQQIRALKTAIKEKKLNIVLILDSYDEMKSDFIQKNLYLTNSLNQEFHQNDIKKESEKQLKIIITTRNEILLSKSYQVWFCGYDISTMKEVEILQFDQSQKESYLKLFTELNIKKFILEMYEYFIQVQNLKFKPVEFQEIWQRVSKVIETKKLQTNDLLLDESLINDIIEVVQSIQLFKNANKVQLNNLTKELGLLLSVEKFLRAINKLKYQQTFNNTIYDGNSDSNFSKVSVLREYFLKNYVQVKLMNLKEKRKIANYKYNKANKAKQIKEDFPQEQLEEQAKQLWETLEKNNILKNFSIDNNCRTESSTQISIAGEKYDVETEANIIVRTLKQLQITKYDFYYSFVQFYHNKQIQKQMQLGRALNFESLSLDLIQYSQSLALDMTKNQLTQVKYKVKGQLNTKYRHNQGNLSWKEMYFNDFQGNGDYKSIIRSCAFLNQKGSNFSFTHKSIQEFYVAKYLIEFLELLKLVNDKKFKNFMTNFCEIKQNSYQDVLTHFKNQKLFKDGFTLDDFNLIWSQYFVKVKNGIWNQPEFNLSLEIFKGCLNLMRFKLKSIKILKQLLLQQIYLSRYDNIFLQAASNSIFILTFINEYFGNDDLSMIKISNTKLNGASFSMANLSGSELNNVDINSCNFNCSNLNQVQWENIKFQNSQNFEGHSKKINDIKLIQNKYLISCSNDGYIIVWDLKSSKELTTFRYHTKQVTALCVFDNEKQFASISLDKQIIFYRINNDNQFEIISNYFCNESLFSLAYQKKQNNFYLGGRGTLWLFDYENRNLKKNITYANIKKIETLSISPDDNFLAVGIEKNIEIFSEDETSKQYVKKNQLISHTDVVLTLQFFDDSRYLVSSGADKIINIWDINTSELFQTISDNVAAIQSVSILTYYEQIKITKLAYGDGKCMKIWDVQARKIINKMEGHANIITTVMFANSENNEKFIVFGSDVGVIRSVSAQNQEESINQEGHSQEVTSVSFSPDGLFVASGSYDKSVKIWETKTGKQVADLSLHQSKITQVLFSPNGEILASISEGKSIYFWDANTYQFIKKIDRKAKTYQQQKEIDIKTQKKQSKEDEKKDLAKEKKQSTMTTFLKSKFNETNQLYKQKFQITQLRYIKVIEDYQFAAGTLDGKVLSAQKDFSQLETIYNHKTAIEAMDYSYGTESIGSGSQDGEIKIWSLKNKQVVYSYQQNLPVLSLALFPDTSEYVSGHQDGIVIKYKENKQVDDWRLGEEEITSIKIIAKASKALVGSLDFSVYQINFNNEKVKIFKEEIVFQVLQISTLCKYLATGQDSIVTLWDIKNNSSKARLKAHVGDVSSICFSDNDEIMASGGTDDVIHIWNLKTNDIKLMGTLYGHSSMITKVDFKFNDENKQILVSSSRDCSIRIWDIKEFEQIRILHYQVSQIISFELFNKIQWLAFASQDKSIAIINMENGKLIRLLNDNNNKKILSFTISQNDNILAVSYDDFSIKIYNTVNWQFTEVKQNSIILRMKFSYFKSDILYLQKKKQIQAFNIQTKEIFDLTTDFNQGQFQLCKTMNSIAYSQKTCLVIMRLTDNPDNPDKQYLLQAKEAPITALAISKDEKYFSTGQRSGKFSTNQFTIQNIIKIKQLLFNFQCDEELISAGWDNEIVLWEFLEKCKQPQILRKFDFKISGVVIINDSTILVSDLRTNALDEFLKLSFGTFSANGEIFVFRSLNGTLQFQDTKQDDHKVSIFQLAHNQHATSAAFSKDGEYFAYGNGDGKIILINKFMDQQILNGHNKCITALTFANNQNLLASGSVDMVVNVWEHKQQRRLLYTVKDLNQPISSLAFLRDDSMLAIGSEFKNILLYELSKKPQYLYLEGHLSDVTAVEFSPNGKVLVSASKDYCVKLWRLNKLNTDNFQKNRVKNDNTNSINFDEQKNSLDKIFCYKTIGLNYSFEANNVTLDGASIKNNDNESLENNFQQKD